MYGLIKSVIVILQSDPVETKAAPPTTVDILENTHYFRVHDYIEQIALINTLPAFIRDHPEVVLIVVDSISFHFRQDFQDMALRTRLLQGLGTKLMEIASTFEVAVVLMNQVR